MRKMPIIISGADALPHQPMIIPSLPLDEWHDLVRAFINRELTVDEIAQVEKMAAHNWTARVAAEAIIGRDLTTEEVAAAHVKMKSG